MALTYTASLELLILDQLLPVYEDYQVSLGNMSPLAGINPELLAQIRRKKPLAALLRPYEPLLKNKLVFSTES